MIPLSNQERLLSFPLHAILPAKLAQGRPIINVILVMMDNIYQRLTLVYPAPPDH